MQTFYSNIKEKAQKIGTKSVVFYTPTLGIWNDWSSQNFRLKLEIPQKISASVYKTTVHFVKMITLRWLRKGYA